LGKETNPAHFVHKPLRQPDDSIVPVDCVELFLSKLSLHAVGCGDFDLDDRKLFALLHSRESFIFQRSDSLEPGDESIELNVGLVPADLNIGSRGDPIFQSVTILRRVTQHISNSVRPRRVAPTV
jgi:hypothetical protein